jgi:hypothetical protein
VSGLKIGSHAHHTKLADEQGVVHKKAVKNTHVFVGKLKCSLKALRKEFGPVLCLPAMMSRATGQMRYSVCNLGPASATPHKDHATMTSVAHVLPGNYRTLIKRHFC